MNHSFVRNLWITLLVIVISCFAILFQYHALIVPGLLALGYGVRHGLDADHILAIDNSARKFQANHQHSDFIGVFFALGHSTIVFFLTLCIVLGIARLHEHFQQLQQIGGVIGSVVSTLFLWLSAYTNLSSLLTSRNTNHTTVTTRSIFHFIDAPYKMYWIGLLFGLGFDTATEVGLLGITTASLLAGFQISVILLLPILFATGMVFTDSFDSFFMSSLYRTTSSNNNQFHVYYKIIIYITAILSFVVGLTELLPFTETAISINDHFEMIGGAIMLVFFIFLISLLFITKWKKI